MCASLNMCVYLSMRFSWRVSSPRAHLITHACVLGICVNHSNITANHTHDIITINKVFLQHIGGGVINQRAGRMSTRVYTVVLFIIIIFIFAL
jgi:hypothetical protein